MVLTSFPTTLIQASHEIVPETPVDRRRASPHVDFISTRDGALLPTEEGDVPSTLARPPDYAFFGVFFLY